MIKIFWILLLIFITLDSHTQSTFDGILEGYPVNKYTYKIDTVFIEDTNYLVRLLEILPNDSHAKKVIWTEKISRSVNDFTIGQSGLILYEPEFIGFIDSKNSVYFPKRQFLKKTIIFATEGIKGNEVILIKKGSNKRIPGLLYAISNDSSALYTIRPDKLFNKYNIKLDKISTIRTIPKSDKVYFCELDEDEKLLNQ